MCQRLSSVVDLVASGSLMIELLWIVLIPFQIALPVVLLCMCVYKFSAVHETFVSNQKVAIKSFAVSAAACCGNSCP